MFSKYDVYTDVQSIYCYKDTDVLINKFNIHNKDVLKNAETEFVAVKQLILLENPLSGRFTMTHLLNIHKFLFEDIYPFAGKISKGDTAFYPPNYIKRELKRVFSTIHSKNFLTETDDTLRLRNLSWVMSELNIIHPFREGNGRSIREFARCMALKYGYHLNWGNTDRDTLINADIASVYDNTAFCEVLKQCLEEI